MKGVIKIALRDIKESLPLPSGDCKGSGLIYGSKLYTKEQRKLNKELGLHKINKTK